MSPRTKKVDDDDDVVEIEIDTVEDEWGDVLEELSYC